MSEGTKHQVFSIGRVNAIAGNTLLELVRLKVFYFLLLFALVLIGSSAFMVEFTFQEQFQVLKDVSLGAMSIFTWLLAVLATAMLIPKEIEDRTLYTILAKPVPRFEYLIGKLIGVLLLLLLSTLLMSAMFSLVLYIRQAREIAIETHGITDPQKLLQTIDGVKQTTFTLSLIPGIAVIYIKAAIFAAITLLISTFASSSIFTVIVSVVIYLIGHVQGIAREAWLSSGNASVFQKVFLGLVALLFPDLQLFNLVDDIVAGNSISAVIFLKTAALGAAYVIVYTLLGYFMFASKEL